MPILKVNMVEICHLHKNVCFTGILCIYIYTYIYILMGFAQATTSPSPPPELTTNNYNNKSKKCKCNSLFEMIMYWLNNPSLNPIECLFFTRFTQFATQGHKVSLQQRFWCCRFVAFFHDFLDLLNPIFI